MELISQAVPGLALAAGLLLLYLALFLYEDEQGKIQNVLENWWVRLSDHQSSALSRQAAFLRGLSELLSSGLDRLLGDRLLSLRAFGVSWCYSMASFSLFLALMLDISLTAELAGWQTSWICAGSVAAWILLGTLPALIQRRLYLIIWCGLLIPVALFLWFLFNSELMLIAYFERNRVPYLLALFQPELMLPALAISFVCHAGFLLLLRWLLRRCAEMGRFSSIVAIILSSSAVAFLLVGAPARYGGLAGGLLAAFNLFDVLVSLLFVLLALVVLAHRLMWPVLNRPIYAFANAGAVRRRSIFGTLGLMLLGASGTPGSEWLKKIVGALLG